MILLAYGSLRKGEYNYIRMVKNHDIVNMRYLGTVGVEGFDLYAYTGYPVAVPAPIKVDVDMKGKLTTAQKPKLVVDIFDVSDDLMEEVYDMELGAGYKASVIKIDDLRSAKDPSKKFSLQGIIFTMDEPPMLIKSGDWVKYNDEQWGHYHPEAQDDELEDETINEGIKSEKNTAV